MELTSYYTRLYVVLLGIQVPNVYIYFSDWHGLAQLVGIGGQVIPYVQSKGDATAEVLKWWMENGRNDATVKRLMDHLEEMERFDVLDDVRSVIRKTIFNVQQSSRVWRSANHGFTYPWSAYNECTCAENHRVRKVCDG